MHSTQEHYVQQAAYRETLLIFGVLKEQFFKNNFPPVESILWKFMKIWDFFGISVICLHATGFDFHVDEVLNFIRLHIFIS